MSTITKPVSPEIHSFLERYNDQTDISAIPASLPQKNLSFRQQAAIMLLLQEQVTGWHIILTKRSDHLNKHPGQVAFPGGKYDETDGDFLITALRETHEEVGIAPELVKPIMALQSRQSRYDTKVYPYVGLIDTETTYYANPDELSAVFSVPIAFLLNNRPKRLDMYKENNRPVYMPCWQFGEFQIWGLTAGILVDFLHNILGYPLTLFEAS